jgi:hypothetical protein
MYTDIPKIDTKNIISNTLKSNLEINKIQKEILHILRTVMEQIYFQFEQQYYKQTDGLAMGATISAILSETYIQRIGLKQIYPILIKRLIIGYFRYVNDNNHDVRQKKKEA